MAATLVAPKTCRRCSGTGDYALASGGVGTCARCGGAGKVESDKATLAATKAAAAAYAAATDALQDMAIAAGRTRYTPTAYRGLSALQANDPARYTKALASIKAGHPGVFQALVDYYEASR